MGPGRCATGWRPHVADARRFHFCVSDAPSLLPSPKPGGGAGGGGCSQRSPKPRDTRIPGRRQRKLDEVMLRLGLGAVGVGQKDEVVTSLEVLRIQLERLEVTLARVVVLAALVRDEGEVVGGPRVHGVEREG